ncbi:MAG: bifunctional DNA-formamidopyrimidine glycosylase/DNA-(apurinic or apyrimidinic site) lyase [Thermoplasmatota archaeon]
MPELPEVYVVQQGLQRLVGHEVTSAWRSDVPLRKPSSLPLSQLTGLQVAAVRRHGKVLFFDFTSGHTLSAHLGMTGKFLFHSPADPTAAHTHAVLRFEETELRFLDPRRFGWLCLYGPSEWASDVDHYGVDGLQLTAESLAPLLRTSRAPLKSFLLDQTKIAGVGNIYACEALWRAGLSPRRLACNTPASKVERLATSIVDVLQDSIAQGGTSFNDYVNSIGEPGKFIANLAVFQQEQCPRGHDVRRMVQSGRSTFYCACQR